MLDTYKARLKGNQVQWTDDRPIAGFPEQEVEVLITVLSDMPVQQENQAKRGERMAQCLEKLARTGGIVGISDAAEWQREIRKDRRIYPA